MFEIKRYSTRIKQQSQARRWVPWTRSHANRAKIRRTATGWRATRCKRVTPSEPVRGERSAQSLFYCKTQQCSEVGSWELGASPTSLSWNRDPGVISKPRSNSSSSNLLETSSPFIIVFFSKLTKLWCLCISPEISIGSIFLLNLSASGKSSQFAAGRSNSQHLHLICPKILFAQKDYLPRIIICPKILFAGKYYLSRKIFAQKYFLSRKIFCSAISFVQKYHLLKNIICSEMIFPQI